jgi:hypothetical protein
MVSRYVGIHTGDLFGSCADDTKQRDALLVFACAHQIIVVRTRDP